MSSHTNWNSLPITQNNALPSRTYYTLENTANIMGCSKADVLHCASTEQLEIVASAAALGIYCVAEDNGLCTEVDDRPKFLDFFVIPSLEARRLEFTGKTSLRFSACGYSLNGQHGYEAINLLTHKHNFRGFYRFYQDGSYVKNANGDVVYDQNIGLSLIEEVTVTTDAIYVMATALSSLKQSESPNPDSSDKALTPKENITRPPHGGTERHAKTRELVLRAALYCKEKWPEQCGTTNREWACCIDEKAPLFWPGTGTPPMALDTIERLLGSIKKLPRDVE